MKKKNARFENLEFEKEEKPSDKPVLKEVKNRRSLELGGEAKFEKVRVGLESASADLQEQVRANEQRRAEQEKVVSGKLHRKIQRDKIKEQELDEDILDDRIKKTKNRIFWNVGLVLLAVVLLLFIFQSGGVIRRDNTTYRVLSGLLFSGIAIWRILRRYQ